MDRRFGRVEAVALGLMVGQGLAVDRARPLAALGLVLVAIGLVRWPRAGRTAECLGIGVAASVLGCLLACHAQVVPAGAHDLRSLSLPWRGEVEAVVLDGPWRKEGGQGLLVDVRGTRRGVAWTPHHGRAILSVRGGESRVVPGARIVTRVTLRAPRRFQNPGSFDWPGFLARRDVYVTGSITAGTPIQIVERPGRAGGGIAGWRNRIGERLDALPPSEGRAVLRALVIGRRDDVSAELRRHFVRVGIAHVLAISGLHVGIVAWCAASVLGALLSRVPSVASRVSVATVARLGACVPMAMYGALGGAGPSVRRAAAVLVLLALAKALDRRPAPLRLAAVVVILLVGVDPGIGRDIGFQLSVAAVTGLVLGASGRSSIVARALGASFGASAATAPLLAHHFQEFSLVAPLAGPILMPLFGTVPVALGVLGAMVEPVSGRLTAAAFSAAVWVLAPGVRLVGSLGAVPGIAVMLPRPSGLEVMGIYAGMIVWMSSGARWRSRVAVGLLCAGLVDVAWWMHVRTCPGEVRATFLDVGQGDAAVVEMPTGDVVVIDGGGFPGSTFDVGAAVVTPFLRSRKIRRIALIVVSHTHPDHFAGLETVLRQFRPQALWWPGVGGRSEQWSRLLAVARAEGVEVRAVRAGAERRFGDAELLVLHPPSDSTGSVNDESLVVHVRWRRRGLVFTGDVERAGEGTLVHGPGLGPADVVKVPHHGSRTSSTEAFVRRLAPEVAVISVGAENRYGHPDAAVEARWAATGACVLRTDRCGAITAALHQAGVQVWVGRGDCRCTHPQGEGAMPFLRAYITKPTRSRTPSL